jgi:hypothetical protein
MMQAVASPAVGLTGAFVAVVIARAARTRPSQVLAAFAVVGGSLSGLAGPLIVTTQDTRLAILFPFQALLALWLIGTGARLWRRWPACRPTRQDTAEATVGPSLGKPARHTTERG